MQRRGRSRKENNVERIVAVQPAARLPVFNPRQIIGLQFCFSTNSGRTE
jgi:hypothetical protein